MSNMEQTVTSCIYCGWIPSIEPSPSGLRRPVRRREQHLGHGGHPRRELADAARGHQLLNAHATAALRDGGPGGIFRHISPKSAWIPQQSRASYELWRALATLTPKRRLTKKVSHLSKPWKLLKLGFCNLRKSASSGSYILRSSWPECFPSGFAFSLRQPEQVRDDVQLGLPRNCIPAFAAIGQTLEGSFSEYRSQIFQVNYKYI